MKRSLCIVSKRLLDRDVPEPERRDKRSFSRASWIAEADTSTPRALNDPGGSSVDNSNGMHPLPVHRSSAVILACPAEGASRRSSSLSSSASHKVHSSVSARGISVGGATSSSRFPKGCVPIIRLDMPTSRTQCCGSTRLECTAMALRVRASSVDGSVQAQNLRTFPSSIVVHAKPGAFQAEEIDGRGAS